MTYYAGLDVSLKETKVWLKRGQYTFFTGEKSILSPF